MVWRNKTGRMTTQIRDICAILSGLLIAQDYKKGQELVKDRCFAENEDFFQVGRCTARERKCVVDVHAVLGSGA